MEKEGYSEFSGGFLLNLSYFHNQRDFFGLVAGLFGLGRTIVGLLDCLADIYVIMLSQFSIPIFLWGAGGGPIISILKKKINV